MAGQSFHPRQSFKVLVSPEVGLDGLVGVFECDPEYAAHGNGPGVMRSSSQLLGLPRRRKLLDNGYQRLLHQALKVPVDAAG